MSRQSKGVRHSFTERFRAKVDVLKGLLPGRSAAITLSRAVDDPDLADEILKAAASTFGKL